ncbi:MAG: ROK family protein [Candidatus Sericytochromatia bacterium]|nr:ROK family protein [Candidatus Tanganyikabacteria bacterium]
MKKQLVAGVDLGGTSLSAVVADPSGNVLGLAEADTPPPNADPGPVIREIARIVREAAGAAGVDMGDLLALGVGAPGTLDPDTGFMAKAVNLGWLDVPFTRLLQDETGLPSFAAGDVQSAIMGEHTFGAAKGAASAIGVWIGTGLGGGIILGGELYRGHSGAAGEIGHMVVAPGGPECGCGRKGCIEAFASRTAIERDLRAAIAAGRKSVVLEIMEKRGKTRITSGILKRALAADDALTMEVLARAQDHLGTFVANLINVLDPEVVVVGGGLVEKLGDNFVAPIRAKAQAECFRRPAGPPRVLPSALGDDAGSLGASEIARRRLNRQVASLK